MPSMGTGDGNYLFLWLSRRYEVPNKKMVVYILCFISLLTFWGLLGFVSGTIGFRNLWEAYLLGAWFGLCLGAVQNFSRTLFLELIPPSHESEYFALYELTDKGSSWLGPLVVAGIAQAGVGYLRFAFLYIMLMTLGPCYFVWTLDLERAAADISRFEYARAQTTKAKYGDASPRDLEDKCDSAVVGKLGQEGVIATTSETDPLSSKNTED